LKIENKFVGTINLNLGMFVVLLALLPGAGFVNAQDEPELSHRALVQELRMGGYNLYFRHVATDWDQIDRIQKSGDWTSCDASRIRQLSDQGRDDAILAGEAILALRIPIGRVVASPYCRTIDTAKLIFPGPVEVSTDVINLRVAGYFGGRDLVVTRFQGRLSTPPLAGINNIFVAHGNLARASTTVYPDEGEAIVFRPLGNNQFVFVGRLTPLQWKAQADLIPSE